MDKKIDFSERLKLALEYRNRKQVDLTREAGLNKSLVSGYMNNKYEAKNDKIEVIAKFLNVSQLYLMGLQEDFGTYKDVNSGTFFFFFDEDNDQIVDSGYIPPHANENETREIELSDAELLKQQIIGSMENLTTTQLQMIQTLIKGMNQNE